LDAQDSTLGGKRKGRRKSTIPDSLLYTQPARTPRAEQSTTPWTRTATQSSSAQTTPKSAISPKLKAKRKHGLYKCMSFVEWQKHEGSACAHLRKADKVENENPNDYGQDVDNEMKDELRSIFRSDMKRASMGKLNDSKFVDTYEIVRIAMDLAMSVEDVIAAKEAFDSFDGDGNGKLDKTEFRVAVETLINRQLSHKLLDEETGERINNAICDSYMWDGDQDSDGVIDFREFVYWYSSNGFSEDFLLTEEEKTLRKLAKTYGVTVDYVEKMKKVFDAADDDRSGEVDIHEFTEILHKCMKVPTNSSVPPSRINYFWTQIDTDRSGRVNFDEFLAWWLKYFDQSSGTVPFESFYKQVRRLGAEIVLDPPAYPPSQVLSEDHRHDSVLHEAAESWLDFGDAFDM
jgi:Ca2+-binding EF-hand superfamily protein